MGVWTKWCDDQLADHKDLARNGGYLVGIRPGHGAEERIETVFIRPRISMGKEQPESAVPDGFEFFRVPPDQRRIKRRLQFLKEFFCIRVRLRWRRPTKNYGRSMAVGTFCAVSCADTISLGHDKTSSGRISGRRTGSRKEEVAV